MTQDPRGQWPPRQPPPEGPVPPPGQWGPPPGAPGPGWYPTGVNPSDRDESWWGVGALIVGLVGLLLSVPPVIGWVAGFVPAVACVVLGVVARRKVRQGRARNGGMAVAGMICGVGGYVLFGLLWLLV